jgi:hypothetical protein
VQLKVMMARGLKYEAAAAAMRHPKAQNQTSLFGMVTGRYVIIRNNGHTIDEPSSYNTGLGVVAGPLCFSFAMVHLTFTSLLQQPAGSLVLNQISPAHTCPGEFQGLQALC